jgi:hypothetical protein
MEISETTRRPIPKRRENRTEHDRNSALTFPVAAAAYPHLHWKATERSRAVCGEWFAMHQLIGDAR